MDEDAFNMSIRKFLKSVGITSQREIENAVRAAMENGDLQGNEILEAKITLEIPGLHLSSKITGPIELGGSD